MRRNGRKDTRQEAIFFYSILVIVDVVCTVLFFTMDEEGFFPDPPFMDFRARWCEGRYFLQHINPNLVVLGEIPVIPEIGNPGYIMTTFPVSYVLGQLLVPAILPYWAAFAWMVAVLILTTVCAWKVLTKYLPPEGGSWLWVCLFLTFAVWNIEGWTYGNYGMILCNLVIIAMDCVDRRPWTAGFLLAVASCKPQLTMMFFFALLFSKKWKPMLIGGFATVGVLVFSGIWLHTPIPDLFSQMSRIGQRFLVPFRYFHTLGVANNLMYYTDSSGLVQLISASICIAVMAGVEVFLYRRGVQNNILLQWALAAVLSTVCAYKYFQDLYVVVIFLLLVYVTGEQKPPVWLLMLLFSNREILIDLEAIIRTLIGEENYWLQLPTVLALYSVWLLCRIVNRYTPQLQQEMPPLLLKSGTPHGYETDRTE